MALEFESKLIENISEFRRLESEALVSGFDKAGLLVYLREKANTNAKIMVENNAIIDEQLRPMLRALNSAEEVDSLFELTQKLYAFNVNLDNGLALEIHKGIIAWARACGDIDRLIRSLYCIGFIYQQILSLMAVRKNHKFFYQEALDAFWEAASYVDKEQYFDIKNKETRMYINRCLGNVYVVLNSARSIDSTGVMDLFFESIDAVFEFWNDEKVRAFDPDFPWDAFIINAHQNVLGWEQILRIQPLDAQNPELVKRVCDSFSFLDANSESISISRYWPASRTESSRRFNRYFSKQISHLELIHGLRNTFAAADDNDYTTNGLFEMTTTPFILITQLEMYYSADDESVKDEIAAILARVVSYFRNVSDGVNRHDFNFSLALSSCAKHAGKLLNVDEYISLLLKFTSYSHLPTYVHTMKVRDLTDILAKYFMARNPQLFIGICGTTSVDDVLMQQEEILELISTSALCHDIGKVIYLDTVSLHSRRLYDFEFEIIKEHARVDTLLQAEGEAMACIADVIMGHHRWYNGSNGYKTAFDITESIYRFIIDMVAVSDSIDAATDTIGRSYSQGLSLEQVVAEIKEGKGTQYSPIIADALSDDELVAQIWHCIAEGRENTYFEVYQDIIGQKEKDKKRL